MNEALEKIYKQLDKEIAMVPVLVTINNNVQTVTPKSIVLNPEWFHRN